MTKATTNRNEKRGQKQKENTIDLYKIIILLAIGSDFEEQIRKIV